MNNIDKMTISEKCKLCRELGGENCDECNIEEELRKEFNRLQSKITYGNCQYCGDEATQIHHLIPICYGGDNRISNLIPLCDTCHSKIHDNKTTSREMIRAGIERAKAEGRCFGRKAIDIDDDVFNEQYNKYMKREMTKTELAKVLNLSRPTLDKVIKEKILKAR